MSVSLRLSRGGSKKRPFFRIVAADIRAPRDGKYLEKLGTYNPMRSKDDPERVNLNLDRIKYWLSVGARPTEKVNKFLANEGLTKKNEIPQQTKQDKPRKKTLEKLKAKEEKLKSKQEMEKAAQDASTETKTEQNVVQEDTPQSTDLNTKPQDETKSVDTEEASTETKKEQSVVQEDTPQTTDLNTQPQDEIKSEDTKQESSSNLEPASETKPKAEEIKQKPQPNPVPTSSTKLESAKPENDLSSTAKTSQNQAESVETKLQQKTDLSNNSNELESKQQSKEENNPKE